MEKELIPSELLREVLINSGVPVYFLAISMKISTTATEALLRANLDYNSVFALINEILIARKNMKEYGVWPCDKEDYDI